MYVNVVRVCVLVAVGKVWKKTNTTSKSRGFWNYARERGESHYQRYVSYSVKWEWEAVISQHSSPDLGINNVTKSVRCHRLATAPLFTSQQTRSAAQGPASNYWTHFPKFNPIEWRRGDVIRCPNILLPSFISQSWDVPSLKYPPGDEWW